MAALASSSNLMASLLPFLCVLVATPTLAQVCSRSSPATTNSDLNVFTQCSSIQGDVIIGSRDCSVTCSVTTLSSLSSAQEINGSLMIQCCANLIDLIGPSALTLIRGSVVIYYNQNLATISGFDRLMSVQGNVEVSQNRALQSITGFGSIQTVSGYLQIDRNTALSNLDGFSSLTTINGDSLVAGHALNILYNTNLTDLSGFRRLTSIAFGTVHVEGNTGLCYAGHPQWGFGSYPLREMGGDLGIDWRTILRSSLNWQYTWDVPGEGYPTLVVQNNGEASLCASAEPCHTFCEAGAGCLGPADPTLCGRCLRDVSLDLNTCDVATQPTTEPTSVPLAVVYGVVFSIVGVIALIALAVIIFCFVKFCRRWRETRKGSFDVDIGMQSADHEMQATSFSSERSSGKRSAPVSQRTQGDIASSSSVAEPTAVGATVGGGSRRKGGKKSGLDNVIVSSYRQGSDYTDGNSSGSPHKPAASTTTKAPPPSSSSSSSSASQRQAASQEQPMTGKKAKTSSEPVVLVSSYRKTTSVVEAVPVLSASSSSSSPSSNAAGARLEETKAADIPMEFPVAQLKLVREIGVGDFGKVFRAEAKKLVLGQKKTTVMVKQLKEGATKQEKTAFIRPVEAMKLLQHPNVLSLLGVCMDGPSIMVILEYCSQGNFKTYLVQKRQDAVAFKRNGQLLRSSLDMATGLMYLHTRNIAHNDFAVRNCMVMGDGAIKLGDYGLTRQTFREDYYSRAPNQKALPIRWMPPEQMVVQGRSVLDSLPVSMPANIWSFGVALWEVCSFAQWPYDELSNEEVIQTVKVFGKCTLENPLTADPQLTPLFDIMTLCWQEADMRPTMADIVSFLKTLQEGGSIDVPSAAATALAASTPGKTSQTGSTQRDAKRRAGSQTGQTGSAQADAKKKAPAASNAKGTTPAPKSTPGQTSQTGQTGSTAARRLSDQQKPRRPAPKKPPATKSSVLKKKPGEEERLLLAQSQPSQDDDVLNNKSWSSPAATKPSSSTASKQQQQQQQQQQGGGKKREKQYRQRTASTEPLVFTNEGTEDYDDVIAPPGGGYNEKQHHTASSKSKGANKSSAAAKGKPLAKYHFEENFEDSLHSSPIQLDLSLPEGEDDGEPLPFQMPPSFPTGAKDDFIIEPPEEYSQTSIDNELDRQQKLKLAAATNQELSDGEAEEEEEEGEGGFPLTMKKFGGLQNLADERTNGGREEEEEEEEEDEDWDGYPVPDQGSFDEFDHRDALEEDDFPNVVYDEDVAALIW